MPPNRRGIIFEDKFCGLRLENGDALEWWWDDPDAWRTVFVVSYCPDNYPALVVHTMSAEDAQEQLDLLLTEGWEITRRGEELSFLAIKDE